jgi:transposase
VCHKSIGYPSDLTNAQWAIIEGLNINKPWGPGRRMRLELRAVINAIFYLLRTGYKWGCVRTQNTLNKKGSDGWVAAGWA